MNVERMLELAERIEAMPHAKDFETNTGFNMERWHTVNPCGTVCCIGGLAASFWGELDSSNLDHTAALLGLTARQGRGLFYAYWTEKDLHEITPAEAAAQLRKMVREYQEGLG